MKSIKEEAKGAHASLDSISQEADRLSTACQQAADRNTGLYSWLLVFECEECDV